MKTLQVGLKCLHYMFDVNVDKFDSTHIHEQFDSQGWLKCLHLIHVHITSLTQKYLIFTWRGL